MLMEHCTNTVPHLARTHDSYGLNVHRSPLSVGTFLINCTITCKYCGENHPAVLQFHHRDPREKEFDVSAFVYHQKGGPAKLEAEIAKCDVLCANCHLKHHYENDERRLRVLIEPIIEQVRRAEQELVPTLEEEIAHAICNNYFPEGIDPAYLTDEFYDGLEQF